MKVLITAFKGKNNSSKIFVENISLENCKKIYLTNSYKTSSKELQKIDLENFDLIICFGENKKLKNEIILEKVAKREKEFLETILNLENITNIFEGKGIKTQINKIPTNYFCNHIYFEILKRNKKSLLIHIGKIKKL